MIPRYCVSYAFIGVYKGILGEDANAAALSYASKFVWMQIIGHLYPAPMLPHQQNKINIDDFTVKK